MDHLPPTWYVSRRVQLPLGAAVAALDRLVEERQGAFEDRPARLTDALVATPSASVLGSPHRLEGHLQLGRLARPVRVELELAPWSRAESELGLRPVRPVPGTRAEHYWGRARTTLDRLSAELGTGVRPGVDRRLRRAS